MEGYAKLALDNSMKGKQYAKTLDTKRRSTPHQPNSILHSAATGTTVKAPRERCTVQSVQNWPASSFQIAIPSVEMATQKQYLA